MFLVIVVRSIIGAIVGLIAAYVLARVMEWYDDRRLRHLQEKTDKYIADAFAPIRELDSRQW